MQAGDQLLSVKVIHWDVRAFEDDRRDIVVEWGALTLKCLELSVRDVLTSGVL